MSKQAVALLIDFGGVLTTATRDAHRDWCTVRGLAPTAVDEVLRAWQHNPPSGGNPVPRVESGDLNPADFERQLADALSAHTGRGIHPDRLVASMLAAFAPDPAMIDIVGQLRSGGAQTILITNSWGGGRPWDAFDILDSSVVSCEVRCRKPDPAIYRLAVEQAGVTPQRCVFVDDLAANVDAALAYGLCGIHHVTARATTAALRRRFPVAEPRGAWI